MILIIFMYKLPRYFLPSFELIGLSVQEMKGRIDFQDGDQLGFLKGIISSIFELQAAPILSTKF